MAYDFGFMVYDLWSPLPYVYILYIYIYTHMTIYVLCGHTIVFYYVDMLCCCDVICACNVSLVVFLCGVYVCLLLYTM
jgi:hypothetical protein